MGMIEISMLETERFLSQFPNSSFAVQTEFSEGLAEASHQLEIELPMYFEEIRIRRLKTYEAAAIPCFC